MKIVSPYTLLFAAGCMLAFYLFQNNVGTYIVLPVFVFFMWMAACSCTPIRRQGQPFNLQQEYAIITTHYALSLAGGIAFLLVTIPPEKQGVEIGVFMALLLVLIVLAAITTYRAVRGSRSP